MDDATRTRNQQTGVQLTREGHYGEALMHFDAALDGAEGVLRANILRDLADVERRSPAYGGIDQASQHLDESLALLGHTDPVAVAATLHFKARLLRQLRRYDEALMRIDEAGELTTFFGMGGGAGEILFISLDGSAILSLAGHSKRGRREAKDAIRCAKMLVDIGNPEVSNAHVMRARVLYLFSFWPTCPIPIIRRAFFGRT